MPKNIVLLSSIVQERGGDGTVSFTLSGEPHATALYEAVRADYHHVTGRAPVTPEDLAALTGQKVTFIRAGESNFGAGSIQATEATITQSRRGLAYLPKGARSNGFILDPSTLLDVEAGYGKVPLFTERIEQVKATFPRLEPLTKEHLLALPDEAPSPAQIGLVVFGTWRGPEGRSPGAVWFLHSYMREDDIAEGFLLVRPEHGVSEHGSIYGQQLRGWTAGRVVDPPAMSFAQAMDLADLDYHQALARVAPAAVNT